MVLPPETDSPALQGLDDRPGHARYVHARMLVEVGVFDGHYGVDQVGGQLGQADTRPPAGARVQDLEEQLAVAVEDLGGVPVRLG